MIAFVDRRGIPALAARRIKRRDNGFGLIASSLVVANGGHPCTVTSTCQETKQKIARIKGEKKN